eukprot:s4670_g4.t1
MIAYPEPASVGHSQLCLCRKCPAWPAAAKVTAACPAAQPERRKDCALSLRRVGSNRALTEQSLPAEFKSKSKVSG